MSEIVTNKYEDFVIESANELFANESTLTCYKLAKLVSVTSKREVRPQMMYNYSKKNVLGLKLVDGKVTSEEAIRFATKFAERNGTW